MAFSVPMHTAMRLALTVCRQIRSRRPDLPLCLYGLYAGLEAGRHEASNQPRRHRPSPASTNPPWWPGWTGWSAQGRGRTTAGGDAIVSLGRGRFGSRPGTGFPPSSATPVWPSGEASVWPAMSRPATAAPTAAVTAPSPSSTTAAPDWWPRTRVVADVAQLVGLGARHITFGDPDFLNGPHHAVPGGGAVHHAFPDVTFDITTKVEHVLHSATCGRPWPVRASLRRIGLRIGQRSRPSQLDKGHTVADEIEAVAVLRAVGIEPRPSLMPFTPWTTAADVRRLARPGRLLRSHRQHRPRPLRHPAARPARFLLISSGALDGLLGPYDTDGLSWTWQSPGPAPRRRPAPTGRHRRSGRGRRVDGGARLRDHPGAADMALSVGQDRYHHPRW